MIVAYLHHLGYVLPPGTLDLSNGLLEFEINHAHLKLLVTSCLPASLDSKNAQKIHHINYILLFNAQKDDKQIYLEICHKVDTFAIIFIPYRPFIPGLN